MDNKNIFAANLKRYMEINNKSRREVCDAIGVSYYTFTDWVNGKKYPRMDKVEKLASYFGILKSELIEEPNENNCPTEPQLSEGEEMLLELFRKIPTDQQPIVLNMIKAALGGGK